MQLHLDPVGGAADDMFIACLLSAFPEHERAVLVSISRAVPEVSCGLVRHNDGVLEGRRFKVELSDPAEATHHHNHHHDGHDHGHQRHDHRHWTDIRAHLQRCGLEPEVLRHAIGIFTLLAEAEAKVHGVSVDAVSFHEIGACDSIADIVGTAQLIALIEARGWSVGPTPLGSGRVTTAHGLMAVPTPAMALLLEGFELIHHGVRGERVTPTGAAILRYLQPGPVRRTGPRRLVGPGVGFGTRILPGLSNCLRVLVFAEDEEAAQSDHRELAVIEFEMDDQSAEDLALGLDQLRAHPSIFDVVQAPAFGKKGRMMTAVRLPARPAMLDEAIAEVFRQTTHRLAPPHRAGRRSETDPRGRRHRRPPLASEDLPQARRCTAKAEADKVLRHDSHARRLALRCAAKDQALAVVPERASEDAA